MTQEINRRLVAFTGPDGIGKTTQCELLVDYVNNVIDVYSWAWSASYIKELNDSNHIYKLAREVVYDLYKRVNTVSLANVIKLNRYILQEDIKDKHYYNEYALTVVDRWNICTYCYLKAKGYDESICLPYLRDEHTIIPGLTIMLVGLNGATRTSNREDNNNMFEDVGDDFKLKLAQTYIDFEDASYAGIVVKINNDNMTKEETHELIKETLLDYFKGEL